MEGNQFVEHCLSDESLHELACMSYVVGVADMLDAMSQRKLDSFKPFCTPDETTSGQLHRVVVKHLKAHPELAHAPALFLVIVALREAFPCQS